MRSRRRCPQHRLAVSLPSANRASGAPAEPSTGAYERLVPSDAPPAPPVRGLEKSPPDIDGVRRGMSPEELRATLSKRSGNQNRSPKTDRRCADFVPSAALNATIGAAAFLFTGAGCGSTVASGAYADNRRAAHVEFKSGGKAWVSAGPMAQACTHSESGKSITLTCNDDNTVFSVDNDGALNGPPEGFLAHLTKKK